MGAISYHKDVFVLATLDTQPGYVRVEDVYNGQAKRNQIHENPIGCLAVDHSGRMGASASQNGTIVRVFDCLTLEILYELRRGSRPASVSSLSFSPDLNYVLAASDHSTVHVWKLTKQASQSITGFVCQYLPNYFQYDRSFAKLNIPPQIHWTCPLTVDVGPVVAFTSEEEFVVAHLDGHLYYCKINGDQIEMKASIAFIDFEGQIVTEGQRQWSNLS